ncbi:hypothetical protein SEUCBS139899_010190 [Sporothrix eucalyptigena]|uniref:DUF6546 domain-containing protein n=1 Tax=Sporothrix eucalyptigena TaxID=1812306 RepID=A0ABP0AZT5_9PEZI
MTGWKNLPLEIRQTILERVAGYKYPPRAHGYIGLHERVARHATVCREWQRFFEQYTFCTLSLCQHSLTDLEHCVAGQKAYRMGYLAKLRLAVELAPYNCQDCDRRERPEEISRNDDCFTFFYLALLRILAQWPAPSGDTKRTIYTSEGLLLSLVAHSVSDRLHSFHDFRHLFDVPEFDSTRPQPDHRPIMDARDSVTSWRHQFANGTRMGPVFPEARERVMGGHPISLTIPAAQAASCLVRNGTSPTPAIAIPSLPVIQCICITRQHYRMLHVHLIAQLVASCPNLNFLRLEHWRQITADNFREVEQSFIDMLRGPLPPSLRHMALYQESYHVLNDPSSPVTKASPCWQVGWAAAKACQTLKSASFAFLADAKDVLEGIAPLEGVTRTDCICRRCTRWTNGTSQPPEFTPALYSWPRLEHLVLTSTVLVPRTPVNVIQGLLGLAGHAAARLPALKTLEIWYAPDNSEHACVFQFDRQRVCTVTLASGIEGNSNLDDEASDTLDDTIRPTPPSETDRTYNERPLPPLLSFKATWHVGDIFTPRLVALFQRAVHEYAGTDCSWGRHNPEMPLEFEVVDWWAGLANDEDDEDDEDDGDSDDDEEGPQPYIMVHHGWVNSPAVNAIPDIYYDGRTRALDNLKDVYLVVDPISLPAMRWERNAGRHMM